MSEISYIYHGKKISYKGCYFRTADIPQETLQDEDELELFLDSRILARQTAEAIKIIEKKALKNFEEGLDREELDSLRRQETNIVGRSPADDELLMLWQQCGDEVGQGSMTFTFSYKRLEEYIRNAVELYAPCYAVAVGKDGIITQGVLSPRLIEDVKNKYLDLELDLNCENGYRAMYDLGYSQGLDKLMPETAYQIVRTSYAKFCYSEYNLCQTDKSEYECIRDYMRENPLESGKCDLNTDSFRKFKAFVNLYKKLTEKGEEFTIDDKRFDTVCEKAIKKAENIER